MSPRALSSLDVVLAYHERTKHHFHRYAASLGYMDWATQPDPFRRFEGCERRSLPHVLGDTDIPYGRVFEPGAIPSTDLSLHSLARFLRYSLSITAWKEFQGNRWALRANPSSGNLHPTEAYVLLPALPGIGESPGLFHYAPREHALERRADLEPGDWNRLFPNPTGFLVGLSSIHWREAWKYGERAFRYCQHDVGHALAALRFAAAALGWRLRLLSEVGDDTIAACLGLDRGVDFGDAEGEAPDLLAAVSLPESVVSTGPFVPPQPLRWYGRANSLSPEHGVEWEAIDAVHEATWHASGLSLEKEDPKTLARRQDLDPTRMGLGRRSLESAILGRRSAVDMDAATPLPANVFLRMLARLLPLDDASALPWDALPWRPRLQLGIFVHRIEGLDPGLYLLARDPARIAALRAAMRPEFLWDKVPAIPTALPLFLLAPGNCRDLAARLSCGQAIAGDGAFSLGMLADYEASLHSFGPGFYRNLFWEAGMIGQTLYLEAEDAGVRATGIGCYFDDPVHETFGIRTREWQSLYHFTVGGAVDDPRLTTLPAYPDAVATHPD